MTQYAKEDENDTPIRFYQQDIDADTYSLAFTVHARNGVFTLTNKYTGFEVYSYRTLSAATYVRGHWEGWTWVPGHYENGTWSDWQTDKKPGDTIDSGYQELEIRFKRLNYDIKFMDDTDPVSADEMFDAIP